MPANACVYGCQGMELLEDERAFFRDARPFGFILFARNCSDHRQIASLCDALRDCVGEANAPIFIDQEGGRVARLKPPHWRARPPMARIGELYAEDAAQGREAAYLCARLIAHNLREVGVNADCAPVLDVPVAGAHDIIGDRAFARDAAVVIELGRAALEGFLEGGVLPVIKHIPGHGRARADSHLELPHVDATPEELSATDFVTFRSLNSAPIAMTAHVVYDCFDAQRPATTSPKVIRDVIRGEIGFDGLLMSDDLSMNALEGPLSVRARNALFAGCDVVLHCNGRMDEMKDVAAEVRPLDGPSLTRALAALAHLNEAPGELDVEAGEARLSELVGVTA